VSGGTRAATAASRFGKAFNGGVSYTESNVENALLPAAPPSLAKSAIMADRTSPTSAKQPGDMPTMVPFGEAPTVPPAGGGGMSDVLPAEDSANGEGAKAAADSANLVGQTIGRYQILSQLGRGGMGVVFLARDPLLDRLAAVKLLVEGELASAEAVTRFQREAQAIARIQHPNIAQVYESGSAGGRPFLVMEYLSGGTLADRSGGRPQRPLEAAAIVETLARAMQAAHDKDVIHRDLKPGNVLAAEDGTLKICDFGLAKRLDVNDGQTATGAILGSPSYMAPEQAGGVVKNVGPTCDVYSLGAVLYELLTGRPPFYAPDAMQTVLMVLADEPVSIRRLQPQVPRDLSTICQKCLEKSPKRRYESAAALADDLDRFRNGLPIAARPVRSWERAIRWARRRPAAAGLIVVSLLAATTLIVGGAWYNTQLRNTNEQLADQLRRSNQLVAGGDDLAQWVLQDHIRDIGRLRGSTAAQKELIDRLRNYLTGLSANANDQDPLLRTIARSWYRLAEVQGETDNFNVGDTTGALASCEEAERMYRRAIALEPDDAELKLALIQCRTLLVELRKALGKPQQEEAELRGIIQDVESLRGNGKIEPARRSAIECGARSNLGWLLRESGRPAESVVELRKALSSAEQLPRSGPDGEKHEGTTELIRQFLAQSLLATGEADEALRQTERAVKYASEQAAAYPDDARRSRGEAIMLHTHGDAFAQLKRFDEAETAYRKAATILRSLADDDPKNALLRNDLAGNADRLASMFREKKDLAAAEKVLRDAIREHARLLALEPKHVEYRYRAAMLANSLGHCLYQMQQFDDSLVELDEAMAIIRALLDEDPTQTRHRIQMADTSYYLGLTHFARAVTRMDDAEVQKAVEMYRRSTAEYAEVDRGTPLGPNERRNFETAKRMLAMTEEMIKQAGPAPTPSPPTLPSAVPAPRPAVGPSDTPNRSSVPTATSAPSTGAMPATVK
jgi:serine/threonine protein kinase